MQMEKYQIFLPVSDPSSPSGSPSSLNMANPLIYFHGENENGVRPESRTQHSDAKHSDPQTSRVSSNSEIKVKPGVRGGDNNEFRKHKYAFQTRSQVDILDDGYRWRKYGQKTVKNSKFPRSYYRCTNNGCNVKKQVQRNSKDEEIVVTTYEGMHTHPIEKCTDNIEDILRQMQTYTPFEIMPGHFL
ncbi:probable WRKY transcription factor 75 isoform X1 [Populus trichocarpa]|uniref:WRKY domain-containing protein n=1 Tax=Populus trichocarpa TaxID=3694 RepID=B9I3U6_POPTR|nr:probable WRKY transcription factor 75 isoform X1 [Populus trichocarpa]|eukprot:XP_002318747.1 probable WRKY transcription factor 75 [Populus trichocarpa]